MNKIEFNKYQLMGAYHWKDISNNLIRHNAGVSQRYKIVIDMLKEFKCNKNSELLDLGCGDGALTGLIFKNFNCKIKAFDTSELGLKLAQNKFDDYGYKAEFKMITGYEYPIESEKLDFVVCAEVIEHVDFPEKMLTEIFRVLKKDGILILSTPIRLYELPVDNMHVKEWFPDEFKKFCKGVIRRDSIRTIYSHPVIWNDLYSINSILFHPIRIIINLSDIFGIKLFYNKKQKRWNSYSIQTLVFKK